MKDRICIKLLNVIILCMLCNMAKGQTKEMLNCPSPEVSSLQMFNNVPVGNYTGTPNIAVPLYTVSLTDKVQIPIQAQYHLANVKPHTPPSTLGVGWALSAGGYITRKVNGIPDETINGFSKNHPKKGFYYNYQEGKFLLESNSLQNTKEMKKKLNKYAINYLCSVDNYELCADEFSFDFCGYSGIFFLDFNGKWQVNSEDNIRVEFDEKTGFGSISELGRRFRNLSYYEGYQRNSQFFKEFTLITPDGTRWTFGGEHAVEYSIPYYHQNSGDLIATSWKLKRVMTVDGEFATFEYKDDAFTCDIHYSPQYSFSHLSGDDLKMNSSPSLWDAICPMSLFKNAANYFLDGASDNISSGVCNYGRSGLTGSLTMPSRLTKIETTKREVIDFVYKRSYEGYRYLDQTGCLYWTEDKQKRMEMYNLSNNIAPELRPERFFLFVNPNVREQSSDNKIRASIASCLTNYLLDSVIVSGNNALDIAFKWNTVSSVKLLSEISFCQQPNGIRTFRSNNKNANKLSIQNEQLKRKDDAQKDHQIITDAKRDSCSLQIVYSYKFDYWHDDKGKYDEYQWPTYRPLTYTDSWGYFARTAYSVPSSNYDDEPHVLEYGGPLVDPDIYIHELPVDWVPYTYDSQDDITNSHNWSSFEKNKSNEGQDYVENNVIDAPPVLSSEHEESHSANSKPRRSANSSKDIVRGYWKFSDSFSAEDFHELAPSLLHAKTYTLRRMYFPSGAYAYFDYELNDYSKTCVRSSLISPLDNEKWEPITSGEETDNDDNASQAKTASSSASSDVFCRIVDEKFTFNAGGLRTKSIEYYDPSTQNGYVKRFNYEEGQLSSGILSNPVNVYDKIEFTEDSYVLLYSFNHIYNQQIGLNTPIVGYSTVVEETCDLDGNFIEKIRYRYSNYDYQEKYGHADEKAFIMCNSTDASTTIPYTTYSFERGKLLSKEVLDSDNTVLCKTSYKYKLGSGNKSVILSQDPICINGGGEGWMSLRCFAYYYPVYQYLVSSEKEEVMYGNKYVSKTKDYKYDDKNMLSEIYTSNGYMWEREKFDYSYNYACYEWMNKYNIILPVIHTTERDGMSVKEVSEISNVGRIPYVKSKKRITKYGADAKEYEEMLFEVKAVDLYALPAVISEKGVNTYVEWDPVIRKPLLVETGGSLSDYVNRKRDCKKSYFDEIKTSYSYWNGKLRSKTMPNQITYDYFYDNIGRLISEGLTLPNEDTKIIKRHSYYYKTQKLE